MSRARVLLMGLVLLAPLLPAATAGIPEPEAWSPYDASATVTQVALARAGTTVAAALGPGVTAPEPTPGVPGAPQAADSDLVILDTARGFARNDTTNAAVPLGRSHVAVSDDGRTVVSLGTDTSVERPTAGGLTLVFLRLPVGGDWATSTVARHVKFLDGTAVGLVLSADGRRVAVATQDAPAADGTARYSVAGYTLGGTSLDQAFRHTGSANLTSLAADANLDVLYVGGSVVPGVGEAARPLVLAVPWSSTTASSVHRFDAESNTTILSVATTARGDQLVAGTSGGRLLHFLPSAGTLPAPASLELGGNVSHVALSADGTRALAAAGIVLHQFDASTASLTPRWNVTLSGQSVRSLALNHTGGITLVASGGAGAGVYAYGDEGGESIWRFNGEAASVAINAAGTEAAYGQKTNVNTLRIPRAIAFEFPTGAKTSTPQTVPPGGNTTYELTIRNPGAGPERVRISGPTGLGVAIVPQPEVVYVRPGESQRVLVRIDAEPDFAGNRVFNLTATSLTSGLRDEVTLSLLKQGTANVSLFLNESDQLAQPGVPLVILLGIENNGSKDAAVGVTVSQSVSSGPEWNVTLDRSSHLMPENSKTTVQVTLTPPLTAVNGTSTTLTFLLEGPEVSDTASVTIRINPQLGLEVTASRRVQFVEPASRAFFNVTVTNTGSIDREFEAFYDLATAGGKSWSVDMDTSTFRLEGGQSRVIPVTVLAPADVTTSDRVSILVTARSLVPAGIEEPVLVGNVTLFANGAVPTPTPEGEDDDVRVIPGPGLGVLLLFGFAVPALRRRRNS